MSNLTVTWPGGIGNPVGERIPISDVPVPRMGGIGDLGAIQRGAGRRRSTRRANRKNRKQTRKNTVARRNRASTRRRASRRTCRYGCS